MITVNMTKAREIAHTHRRVKRAEAFAPLDIAATIPSISVQAENDRQVIREDDHVLQAQMDAAKTPEELAELM